MTDLIDGIERLRALENSAIHCNLGSTSFAQLCERVETAASVLCATHGASNLSGERVVLLAEQNVDWLASFLGIILAGGIAVPLSPAYPPLELEWFADNAEAKFAITDDAHRLQAPTKGRIVFSPAELTRHTRRLAEFDRDRFDSHTALLLYTSGTTGKPKGVCITHRNLSVQAKLLRDAWDVTERDRLLHCLPLHHLHGLGISLLTALFAGASIRMLPRFDARTVVDELRCATLFMGVPTMYHKLRDLHEDEVLRAHTASLRLATSGSAALPSTLASWWQSIAGQVPLERFGMTEIGVGFSNPLDSARRRSGTIGFPLPTVDVKMVDDMERETETGPGELWIRGPSVFSEYWRRPEATAEAFVEGWFRTGDLAMRDSDGMTRLLGRTSVDILKSGGYKISALEIEEVLRDHPSVVDAAVVGIADEEWGDRVTAALVLRPGSDFREAEMRLFAKTRLAGYKVPRAFFVLESFPRNAIGKVLKPELVRVLTQKPPV